MTDLLDGYIERRDLAERLGVSEKTVSRYESVADGLPSVRVGARKLYRVDSVRAWLEAREHKPNPRRARVA